MASTGTDLTDGWLVLAIVAQEHIEEFRHGVMSVHPRGNSIEETPIKDNSTSSPHLNNLPVKFELGIKCPLGLRWPLIRARRLELDLPLRAIAGEPLRA
jgi:hypothetical protein